MPDDDIMKAGSYRYNGLGVYINQEQANAQVNRFNGDLEALSENLTNIANARAEQRALADLHAEIVAAETPHYQAPLTAAEREALPVEKMTPLDGLWLAQKGSRFEGQVRPDDPNVVRGYYETLKRQQRGE